MVLDLEDAVPFSEKESTRTLVREVLDAHPGKRMYVRINALSTPYALDDIAAIGSANLHGIMLPKVEKAGDICEIDRLLSGMEKSQGLEVGGLEIISICETARGLEEVYLIASAKPQRHRDMVLAFGAADYTMDLGIALTRRAASWIMPRPACPSPHGLLAWRRLWILPG